MTYRWRRKLFVEIRLMKNLQSEYILRNQRKGFRLVIYLTLLAYILNFVISPVYASAADVMEAPRFDTRGTFNAYEQQSLEETDLLHKQFRLWRSVPEVTSNSEAAFEESYRPSGWTEGNLIALAFQKSGNPYTFSMPVHKNFVCREGVSWLQSVYGCLGWHFRLSEDKSSVTFSYKPEALAKVVSFVIDKDGKVTLNALNATEAIFYTSSKLSISLRQVDNQTALSNLIFAAPTVSNDSGLTASHVRVFANEHINNGGYTLENGEFHSATTVNKAPIKTHKTLIVRGKNFSNQSSITSGEEARFDLESKLDNEDHSITSGTKLSIKSSKINNKNGLLQGEQLVAEASEEIDNRKGKLISQKSALLRTRKMFSEGGLISSKEGLDLREIGHINIGNIITSGNLVLKEGHFTFEDNSVISGEEGLHDGKVEALVIDTGPLSTAPIALNAKINALHYTAKKATRFGTDVVIDSVEAEKGVSVTFTPGSVKKFKSFLKDNPLSPELTKDLERLEWLLEDESDVLPYDISMLGQLVMVESPGAIISKWMISKNAYARNGLELHLRNAHVEMGDKDGRITPDWSADTGRFHIFAKSYDQKSGVIAARAGGSIQAQGKVKIGEAHIVRPDGVWVKGYNSLGAGSDFLIRSTDDDIIFRFAAVELARFCFAARNSVSLLSSHMKTKGGGVFRGERLLFSPDVDYVRTINLPDYCPNNNSGKGEQHYTTLVRDISNVYVDGDITLDISEEIKPIGSIAVASGKLHNTRIPRQPLKPEAISLIAHSYKGFNCCKGTSHGWNACGPHVTYGQTFMALLMSSDQMILSGHKTILDGILSAPRIELFTNEFRMEITANRRQFIMARPDTLYNLANYVEDSPFHIANPNRWGPSIIHRFFSMPAPAMVYFHHGRLSTKPATGARLRFDHAIVAQSMAEVLVRHFAESYIQPHASFEENYAFAAYNGIRALEHIRRINPRLVDDNAIADRDTAGQEIALPASTSVMELARYVERESQSFNNRPIILNILNQNNEYAQVMHMPGSAVHRSLQRGENLMLGRERIAVLPLDPSDASQRSSFVMHGGAVDSEHSGLTSVHMDAIYTGAHRYTETHVERHGRRTDVITEQRADRAFIGGTLDLVANRERADYEGTILHIDGDSRIRGSTGLSLAPTYTSRDVQSTSSSRTALAGTRTSHSSTFEQTPVQSIIEGNERLLVESDGVVDFTAPITRVPVAVNAAGFNVNVAHRTSGSSGVTSNINPFVERTTTSTSSSDIAVPPVFEREVRVNLTPTTTSGAASADDSPRARVETRPGESYANLTFTNPNTDVEYVSIADVHTSSRKTHTSPGVATIGALSIAGAYAGGGIFTGVMKELGIKAVALKGINAMAFVMAKAATGVLGASAAQGAATGRFNLNGRSLAVAVLTAGLVHGALELHGAPALDAKATFGQALTHNLACEAVTAPVRVAVNTVVGHQKVGDAVTSTLRQGVGSAVGASLAHRIGQLYQGDDKIGYVNHKLLHFISGGIAGTISHNDPIGGALGAAFAEVAMEGMSDAQAEAQSILAENPDISREDFNELIRERMGARRMFSQIIGGFAGALGGGDFDVASNTACIALDNNMLPSFEMAAGEVFDEIMLERLADKLEAGIPLTPRTKAAQESFDKFSKLYQSLDEVQKEAWRQTGQSPEIAANNAYAGTQRLIAEEAIAKVVMGESITDYEKGVIIDAAKSGAITLSTQVAASIGLGVIASTVTKTFVKVAGDKVVTASTQAAREGAKVQLRATASKYESVLANIPGKVLKEANLVNRGTPGELGILRNARVAESFSGGRYAYVELEQPLVVHRAWTPGKSKEFGNNWSLEKPVGSLQTCIDSAIQSEWNRLPGTAFTVQLSEFTTIRLPAGRRIYAGEVGYQGGVWVGGNSQIYIADTINPAWKIGGGGLQ